MSLQNYYDNFCVEVSMLAHHDPEVCLCKGGGWVLSDVDTWHECPCHKEKPHPESEYDETPAEDQPQATVTPSAVPETSFDDDECPF